jgi:hypothetical protein
MSTTAAIAAIGAAVGHSGSPEKVDATGPAFPAAEHDFNVIYKILI